MCFISCLLCLFKLYFFLLSRYVGWLGKEGIIFYCIVLSVRVFGCDFSYYEEVYGLC